MNEPTGHNQVSQPPRLTCAAHACNIPFPTNFLTAGNIYGQSRRSCISKKKSRRSLFSRLDPPRSGFRSPPHARCSLLTRLVTSSCMPLALHSHASRCRLRFLATRSKIGPNDESDGDGAPWMESKRGRPMSIAAAPGGGREGPQIRSRRWKWNERRRRHACVEHVPPEPQGGRRLRPG